MLNKKQFNEATDYINDFLQGMFKDIQREDIAGAINTALTEMKEQTNKLIFDNPDAKGSQVVCKNGIILKA